MSAASLAFAILAVGLLIIIHEYGHYWVAKKSGMRVSRFSVGFGPVLFKTDRGETQFRVSAIPLGGYVQIDGMSPNDGTDPDAPGAFSNRPFHLKFATILAGPFANYLLGFFLLFAYLAAFYEAPFPPVKVLDVLPDSGAAEAGLQKDDLIVGVRNTRFETVEDFGTAIEQSGGAPIPFQVVRDGQERTVAVTPKRSGDSYRLGVSYDAAEYRVAPQPVPEAFVEAGRRTVAMSVAMLVGLARIFDEGTRLSGPIGIVKGLSRQVRRSVTAALGSIAQLSIALGLFNLLPIPALDGSRLLFLLVGAIRRKPVEPQLEQVIHFVGFVLLLGLLLIVSIKDVTG